MNFSTAFSKSADFIRKNIIIITLATCILFQALFIFSKSIDQIVTNTTPDDAFYYFTIARNIAEGYGSTFDKVNLTNGYHPLWMYTILPIFYLFGDGTVGNVTPIYVIMFLSLVFSFFTGLVLLKLFNNISNQSESSNFLISTAILFYFLNPFIIYNTFNGLETSLLIFFLSLLLLRLQFLLNVPSKRNFIYFGVISAFVCLARLDMIILISFLYAAILIKYYKLWKNYLYALFGYLIIFLPWQIYNFVHFKMFLTSASVTSTFVNHQLTYSDNGGYSLFLFLKTIIYNLDRAILDLLQDTGNMYTYLFAVAMAIYFLFKNFSNEDFKNKIIEFFYNPYILVSSGLIGVVLFSAGIRWTYRSWYFIPLIFVSTFLFFYVFKNLHIEFPNKFKYFLVVIIIFQFSFYYINYEKKLKDREALQRNFLVAADWQNQNLPPGSVIGVFNAGIQGYFNKNRVINLDGLVNINASQAMLSRQLWKYIKNENVQYISDVPSYMTYRYRNFLGIDDPLNELELIREYSDENVNGRKGMNLYKVK